MSQTVYELLPEEIDLLIQTLREAKSDIWQTLRVSESNLNGIDPCFPEDEKYFPNPPRLVDQGGINESYERIAKIEKVQKMLWDKVNS